MNLTRLVQTLVVMTPILAAGLPGAADTDRLTLVVSVLPQSEIAHRIVDDRVDVAVLVPPGSFPATFEPTPKQMAITAEADLWLQIGIPFESAIVDRILAIASDLEIIDGIQGIERRPIAGDDHGHGALDPHIWLDPDLIAVHARILCEALCIAAPGDCDLFRGNLGDYETELAAADERITTILQGHAGKPIFVFHPAYGYLAHRYGLIQIPVEVEGKVPTGRRLAALVERARTARARSLLVQPQFAGGGAAAAASAMGVEIVEVDPLAPDLAANLERMAAAIADSFGDTP